MHRISFGNGDKCISTITFKVRCHPYNAVIQNKKMSIIPSHDKTSHYDDHIHYVPYGLIRYSSLEWYKYQITTNNNFLHKLANAVIYNIYADVICSEVLLYSQDDMRFEDFERTHSTGSDGKYIILTTKVNKDPTSMFVDKLIENSNTPNSNLKKRPGRSTKYDVNSTLVSYTTML